MTNNNTLKWCAIVLALILGVASIASMHLKTLPVNAAAPETEVSSDIAAFAEENGFQPVEEPEKVAEKTETVRFTLKVDGNVMLLASAQVTVGEMLAAYNIPVGKNDRVTPGVNKMLKDDSTVVIERITFKKVVESEAIPFKTETKGTADLPAGTKKVVQKGQKGEAEVTYKITYSDGKEVSRKEVSRKVVKKPVKKIIAKSTVGTIAGKEYTKKFTVKAYSYTGGGRTASGLPAAHGRIAVDPSVIPLGTRVYVEGYGFAVAADTGGNIKGNTIDVYFDARSSCIQWGCRHVTIYILK